MRQRAVNDRMRQVALVAPRIEFAQCDDGGEKTRIDGESAPVGAKGVLRVRVLRPGGHAFAFDPNLLHPAMALFRYPKSPLYTAKGVSPNEAPLLPRQLHAAFTAAGFVELRQRAQSDLAYREVAPRVLNACLAAYNFADHWFERVGLGRWFGTFVITSGQKPG